MDDKEKYREKKKGLIVFASGVLFFLIGAIFSPQNMTYTERVGISVVFGGTILMSIGGYILISTEE